MTRNRTLTSVCIVGMLALPVVAGGASFDCAKASTKIERLICSSPELSELDTKVAKQYGVALVRSPDPQALRLQQREWLRNVRDRCVGEACLRSVYTRRSRLFEWTKTLGSKDPLCEELRFQKGRGAGATAYTVQEEEISRSDAAPVIDGDKVDPATHAIRNVDVDGDKVDDQLLLSRTGSASLMPPDNSWFSLALSSTGNEFRVEAMRLYVIRYKSSYYLLTRRHAEVDSVAVDAGDQALMIADVYRLGRSGIAKVCSYECGLPYGYCSED